MVETYKEMFGQDVKVEAIHAGLECGIMISKLPGLDCVSFGPNIYNIHTTEEKLSISSTLIFNSSLEACAPTTVGLSSPSAGHFAIA